MSDQVITVSHSGDDKKTFSKEEICSICDLSPSTLQNWLMEEKAEEKDYITGKMGKKFFYFSYIKRVFKKALREDLIEQLANPQKDTQRQAEDNPTPSQSLPDFDFNQLLTQQAEIIKTLQEQLNVKDGQIRSLTTALENAQKITSQQQSLSLQQSQLLLEDKKTKRGGFFGLFGNNSQKEEK